MQISQTQMVRNTALPGAWPPALVQGWGLTSLAGAGGAVAVDAGGRLVLRCGSSFSHNMAAMGGAVYMR